MNKIIMDFGAVTTKTALVEDGALKELFVDSRACFHYKNGNICEPDFSSFKERERRYSSALHQASVTKDGGIISSEDDYSLVGTRPRQSGSIVGNIYVGVVKNIVSKQFVFIDIGLSKNAFMQLSDHKEHAFLKYKNINIGQNIIVQVIKDEKDEKGALVTTEVSLAKRGLALIPKNPKSDKRIFISSKLKEESTREKIENFVKNLLEEEFSAIVRTNSKDMSLFEIQNELETLKEKYKDIMAKGQYVKGPALLYREDLHYGKSLKTILSGKIDEVIINSSEEVESVCNILTEYGVSERLKLYDDAISIFDNYGLEKQIKTALNKKVWLKSGGFIVIEKTEACYVIDVNTGKFTTSKNKEKTVLKNNLEAAEEIAKQIRLRNLSGMIIVDFVDMKADADIKWVMAHFKRELKKDRVNVNVVDISSLNIVQLTRKYTRPALFTYFTKTCAVCDGQGYVQNIDYIAEKIYNMINRILIQTEFNKIVINSNNKVINFLKIMPEFDILCNTHNAEIIFNTIITGKIDYFEIEKSIQ